MSRRHVAAVIAAAVVAGTVVASAPATAAKQYDIVRKDYVVKTKHGDIFVHVAHAADGESIVKAPSIFTYSPYSILGAPPNYRRAADAERWVPRGYHRVWADVVGTGNSGGCWDYGGKREQATGVAVVEWIAKQKWSTGKVAMIGGSYEGTTATATAIHKPKGLVTIVPEAAISRWYGYSYSGGIRYFWNNEAIGHQGPGALTDEGFDTPLAFDFGLAIPPPLDPQGENWGQRVQSTMTPCEELQHTEHGYDDTPDYDKFWKERDYLDGAKDLRIPVLVAHNWGDWNVKQQEAWNLFHALDRSRHKVLFMGTRWQGHDEIAGNFNKVVDQWMDHYLMGKQNGANRLPEVVSQTSTNEGPAKWYRGGVPKTKDLTLVAQETIRTGPCDHNWKILPHKPGGTGFGAPSTAQFPSSGVNVEAHMNHHYKQNHDWMWFESPPLRKDIRIFGSPEVHIYSTVFRRWVTYTPVVVDLDHSKHVMVQCNHVTPSEGNALLSVTRGFHDSRYRDSLAKQTEVKPGVPFGMTVVTKPQDYVFKKGHQIGLNIATEINEWALPKPYPCDTPECVTVKINWTEGKTKLVLPVVGGFGNPMSLFDMSGGHH